VVKSQHAVFIATLLLPFVLAGCFDYLLPDLPGDQTTDSELDPVNEENSTTCGNGIVDPPGEECDGDEPGTCTTGCGTEGTRECIACKWVCVPPPDTDCDTEDEDCDTIPDDDYVPTTTCGIGGCRRDSVCTDGEESCTPGTPEAADPVDEAFNDADCDGTDGEPERAVFVATGGDDANPGTMEEPKATIQAGIDAAAADETKDQVYVSLGEYHEEVTLVSGVSVYGGYNAADDWIRSMDNTVSIVSPTNVGVRAEGIDTPTDLGWVTVRSSAGEEPGEASYGILVSGSSALQVISCTISAGRGAGGMGGRNGDDGEGFLTDPSAQGQAGGNGCEYGCHCASYLCDLSPCGECSIPLPGAGGTGPCGRNGGSGGSPGGYVLTGQNGQPGDGGASGGTGGPPTGIGVPGGNGQNGASPPFNSTWNGAGGNDTGTISGGLWHPSDGAAGHRGAHGDGGGGGGGGGGDPSEDCFTQGWCMSYGGAGGGGGGGGCGGYPGTEGTGGGGSFGILLIGSTIEVHSCAIWTAGGGDGGRGGNGGSGGQGGPGGMAGLGETPTQGGPGGQGGSGGDGGRGGAGGGGGGGPSVGIALDSDSTANESGNTYSLGPSGTGGASTGNPGQNGVSADTHSF
jgi:hypothetical protein